MGFTRFVTWSLPKLEMVMKFTKTYSYFDGSEVVRSADADALYRDLLGKIREAFGVKRFEDGGITEMETVMLLHHFLIFMGHKEKSCR